jgi:hypothetical protein
VVNTIYPSMVGCLPTLYTQFRPAFATFVTPERINPYPVTYVYLQLLLDGADQGMQHGYVVSESLQNPSRENFTDVRSLARLLIGNKRSDLAYDRFDGLNAITFNDRYQQYTRLGVRVIRPDGKLYNFHANPFSVTLTLTLADRPQDAK